MTTDTLTQFTTDQIAHARSLDYMRWLQTLYSCNGSALAAVEDFALRYPRSLSGDLVKQIPQLLTKAASTPGTSTEPGWAAPVAVPKPLPESIVALSRARSLLGKFGDAVRHVPLNISVPAQSGGATFAWNAPGGVLPAGSMALHTVTVPPAVAGGILIVTKELMTVSTPSALTTLRDELTRGLSTFLDDALLSTAAANTATGAPAGLLNAAPSFGSAGATATHVQTDVKKLIADFGASNPNVESAALIMSPWTLATVAMATQSPTLTDGSTLYGFRIFTSPSAGANLNRDRPGRDSGRRQRRRGHRYLAAGERRAINDPDLAGGGGHGSSEPVALGLVGLRCRRYLNFKRARTSSILFTTTSYSGWL